MDRRRALNQGRAFIKWRGVAYSREELVWYYSDFRRKDGGKKRTAKRMCVTIVTGLSLAFLSWSSFYTNVFRPFTKQNYCHACHTTFGVFFSLSSCCISSLIWTRGQALIRTWAPIREKRYNGYVVAIIFGMQVWSQVYLIRGGFTVVQVTVWEGWLSQLWGIGSSLFPELQRNFKRGR